MNRRSLLRRAVAAGSVGLVSGCFGARFRDGDESDRPAAGPATDEGGGDGPGVPHADEFGTVVDAVETGADPTGETPVDDVLAGSMGDDTLVYFPAGEYLLSDRVTLRSFSNLGVVGRGATIRPANGYAGYLLDLGRPGEATDLLVDGLRFDVRADATGARVLHAHADDGLSVTDLTVRGVTDTDQTALRLAVTSPDGSGTVRRLCLSDGGAPGTGATGCYVPPRSVGELSLLDCHVASFPGNGLYASAARGVVRVVGGRYDNNGIAGVRVGDGAVVRGVVVRCDDASRGFPNMRGIRVDGGQGIRIEDSTVVLREVTGSDGAVVLSGAAGSTDVVDTRITVDTDDVAGILAKPPSSSSSVAGGTALRCRNVAVSGSASGGRAIDVRGRDGCLFEDVAVCQSGADRDGIRVVDATGGLVRDAAVSVTGRPLVFEDADVGTDAVDTGLPVEDCRRAGGVDCGLAEEVWPYAGTDCSVDAAELDRAIDDWAAGAIPRGTLGAVVRAWAGD